MKKLPPGTFIATKNYEFSAPVPVVEETGFSPVLSCKTKEKTLAVKKTAVKKAKILKKDSSFSSASSTCIKPNYPKPISREGQKEKTVAEILFEYQSDLEANSMFPLQKSAIKPNILLTIQQRPFSATAKMMDVYNKDKAKTIQEIRTQEKFKGRADSAVKTWLDRLSEDQEKANKVVEANVKRFKRAEDRLASEISQLMKKIKATKGENESALKSLQSRLSATSLKELPLDKFTKNGRPVTATALPDPKSIYSTEVLIYNSNPSQKMPEKPLQEPPAASIISDDDSFIRNISSPEDFEMLSDDEIM